MTYLDQAVIDAAAARASQASTAWCGHSGRYLVRAILCMRGGQADRLMACEQCGREYLASYLATVRPPSPDEAKPQRVPLRSAAAAHRGADEPGHDDKERHMSVPVTRTGNPKARRKAQEADSKREDLGPGSIAGNLTADPELRFTPSGRAITKMRVAWTPRLKNEDTGKWEDGETEFFNVDVWGQQAENCAEHLRKGDRVVADGQWSKRSYENKEGETVEVTELTARDVGPSLLFRGAKIVRSERSGGRS